MTEQEWLAATDPTAMLEFLRGKASERKLRLFAVAACRHSLWCFGHYDLDEVVDWGERDIEEAAKRELPEAIIGAVRWACSEMCESLNCLGNAVSLLLLPEPVFGLPQAQQAAKAIIEAHQIAGFHSGAENEARHQCVALHDIFGNPFRPVSLDPSWRTSTIVALATQMYDSRDFSAMPILADALMDAGCDDAEVLGHCRAATPHVRGCWVADLVLDKK